MTYIKYQTEQSAARLILDRPDKYNAFNSDFIEALQTHLLDVAENDTHRSLILSSSSKHFCAGADINWMRESIAYTKEQNYDDASALATMLYILYELPIPTIALANGRAMGGGVGLLACCDIVLAEPNAQFCFSEVKIGLAPATISPFVINRIGAHQAKRYFMTAEMIHAQEALRIGLIDEIVETEQLEARAKEISEQISQNAPGAVLTSKHLAQSYQEIFEDTLEDTADLIAQLRISEEGQEGLNAFLDKRTPNWITHND